MKKITVFSLLLLIILCKVQAQTIKGVIGNSQKKALPFADITLLENSDSGFIKITQSGENGLFSFHLLHPGTYHVEVTMIGYATFVSKPVQLTAGDTAIDLTPIILAASDNLLAAVTVTSNPRLVERRIDKTVVNIAGSITSEGSTAMEIMQKLPGVQVTPEGQVSMNGKSGVSVYIDGKPTNLSADDLAALLSSMSSSVIQKIEIMTNPSSRFDAGGSGGIINIIKKRNRKEGLNGSVNGTIGQGFYSRYNGGVTLNYKNKKMNLFFSNTLSYNKTFFNRGVSSDIYDPNNILLSKQVSDNDNINSGSSYRPTLAVDLYASKKTTLSLSATAGIGLLSNDKTISGMDIFNTGTVKINHIAFTGNLDNKPFNYTTGFQLVHSLDTAGQNFSIDIDYSNYRNQPLQTNLERQYDANNIFLGETDALLQQRRQLNIYSVKADYTKPLPHNGNFEAGLKSSYVRAANDNTYYNQAGGQNLPDPLQSNYAVNDEMINALYISLNQTVKKIALQFGLRAEQTMTKGEQVTTGQIIRQNYLQLFPTLFAEFPVDKNQSVNIRIGRRTDRAAYSEMVPFRRPQTATLYFQGNPDLKPQLTTHGELTWSWQKTFFITAGYDITRDYIRTLPFLDSNHITVTRIPSNVQGSHSWNIDLAYSHKITTWWSTDNTVSVYLNAFSGNAAGFDLYDPGLVSVYLSSNNSFTINKSLSAEMDLEYNSKRQLVTSSFGPYSLLNIGVKKVIMKNKATVALNAHNLLQDESHNAIDRSTGLYQYAYWNFYTRYVSVSFSYRFGNGKTIHAKMNSGSADEQGRANN